MKKFFLGILLTSFSIALLSQSVKLDWANSMGSHDWDAGYSIDVDPSGNVYVVGHFLDTVDFDPGPSTFNLISNGTNFDIYIQKLSASGNLIWAKSIGGTAHDHANGVKLDDSGNIYVTGQFHGTVDFDPDTTVFNLNGGIGLLNSFVLKLDANGKFLWAKDNQGSSNCSGISISIDSSGNSISTGSFYGSVDFDPGTSNYTLNSNGSSDIYIQKLDSSGNFIWAKSVGGTFYDFGTDIESDASGNIYISGYYRDTVDFDPGSSTFYLNAGGYAENAFVLKLDVAGNFAWALSYSGNIPDARAYSINLDAQNNVYTTGNFRGTLDFNPGPDTFILSSSDSTEYNAFIQKFSSSGKFIWAKSLEGPYSSSTGSAIEVDNLGNNYVIGYYLGTTDFDPGVDTFLSTSSNIYSLSYILKLDSAGDFNWAKTIGAKVPKAIVSDANSNVYSTGFFSSWADLDPGPATQISISNGAWDAYTLKLKPCTPDIFYDSISTCGSYTWINGKTYSNDNYTARHFLTNASGCDSIVYLKLNIIGPIDDIQEQVTACVSYTWHGITYYNSINGLIRVFTNSAGCDSIRRLRLTIKEVNRGIIRNGPGLRALANGAKYQWLDCNKYFAPIVGATSQDFTALVNGRYAVEVTENGCVDTSTCVTIDNIPIGIEDGNSSLFKDVSIYPNPSNGIINIELGGLKDVSISIYDLSDKLIFQEDNVIGPNHQFDLQTVPGIYVIELSAKEEKHYYKLFMK